MTDITELAKKCGVEPVWSIDIVVGEPPEGYPNMCPLYTPSDVKKMVAQARHDALMRVVAHVDNAGCPIGRSELLQMAQKELK